MNIDFEKEKAKYQHKLELFRLIIDRLLMGIILVGLGFAFNIALEDYKRKQTEQQFYLEKKFEAVNAIRTAYMKVFNAYYVSTIADKDKSKAFFFRKEPNIEYFDAIVNFNETMTKYDIVLSERFFELAQANSVILEGMYYKEPTQRYEYREFLYHIGEILTDQCRIELGLSSELQGKKLFPIEKMKFEEIHSKGSPHFLNINYEKWKLWKKQNQ
jgi:hypothetical protein